jgi:RNA polymerase sigma-70 factor (ECF subfamily)
MRVAESADGARPQSRGPSFPEVFGEYAPFLWRALIGLGVHESDAQDLCQEVMLVVHRRLAEFQGHALKSWLYGICIRVASDYRRSARVRREYATDQLPETSIEPTQLEELEARRAERRLHEALETLDEDKRVVFVLFEIEQLTLREIAEIVESPLQTVYSRLHAARAHVRQAFGRSNTLRGLRETG